MLYNYIISDAFFLFFKKMKFTNFMEQFRRFFAKFWPFFLPFFKKCRKMVNFHFFEKQKKCIRDYLVIKGLHSPWFWNVDFESVTTLDARARALLFDIFFPIWPPKKNLFFKFFFFFFSWPKIHMYAKNEVSSYKTKKKTIWDCTLPLRDLIFSHF